MNLTNNLVEKIFFLFLLLLSIFFYTKNPVIINRFGHDVVHYLDIIYRIENGQMVHRDFNNVIGIFFFNYLFFFFEKNKFDLISFNYANAFFCFILIIYFIFSNKNKNFIFNFIFFLYLLFLSFSLNHIGVDNSNTYANIYNRWGYLLVSITFANLFIFNRGQFQNLIIFLTLLLTLFIKHTFLFTQLSLIICYILLKNENLFISLVKFIFFIILLLISFYFINFLIGNNVISVLNDYTMPGKARVGLYLTNYEVVLRKFLLPYGSFLNKFLFTLIEFLIFFSLLYSFKFNRLKEFFSLLLLFLNSVFLHLTNYGHNELVLSLIYFIFFFKINFKFSKKLIITILILTLLPSTIKFIQSYIDNHKVLIKDENQIILGKFKNLNILNADGIGNEKYKLKITDACDLVKNNVTKIDEVLVLNFENFIYICTETNPTKNILTLWHFGTTFSYDYYPNFDKEIKKFKYLLIPDPYDEDTIKIKEIYNYNIQNKYSLKKKTKFWALYVRK